MQDVVIVPNEVAAELAGVTDGVLDSLRDRLGCSISLRGNKLTLDGDGGFTLDVPLPPAGTVRLVATTAAGDATARAVP